MDYLFAKTRGKVRGNLYKVLSLENNTVYEDVPSIERTHEYDDEYKIHEEQNEWFVINNFSMKPYCLDFLKDSFIPNNYSQLEYENYKNILYLMSLQHNEEWFCFQKLTPSRFYEKRKWLDWLFDSESQPQIHSTKDYIEINDKPDAIYKHTEDKLYFQRLSNITNIFNGINELYNEATDQEVDTFLQSGFISLINGYDKSKVKTMNRRKIREAQRRYANFNDLQKQMLPEYIRKYTSDLCYDDNTAKFKISSEEELTLLLNAVNQRFYTTEIEREKKLANSVTDIA